MLLYLRYIIRTRALEPTDAKEEGKLGKPMKKGTVILIRYATVLNFSDVTIDNTMFVGSGDSVTVNC